MNGNSYGKNLRMTTWGESHQKAMGVTLDGIPSGLEITEEEIQREVDKRRPGQSDISTGRKEEDRIIIQSGLLDGKTTGAPLTVEVKNKDVDSSSYDKLRDTPRPGHADLTYRLKYGFHDHRGGGRASGRETVSWVIAGAVAKKLLEHLGVKVVAHTIRIDGISMQKKPSLEEIERNKEKNSVRCADLETAKKMEKKIKEVAAAGDSTGGVVEVIAVGIPAGLGEPVFQKLDAELAKALMSIPAVKGVEIGAGFRAAELKGSENNDPFIIREGRILTETNNAGGILGGISNGMPIVARIAVKPTSSIALKQKSVNMKTMEETELVVEGRHDPNITPRVVPVAEAMMAFVLADYSLAAGLIPSSK